MGLHKVLVVDKRAVAVGKLVPRRVQVLEGRRKVLEGRHKEKRQEEGKRQVEHHKAQVEAHGREEGTVGVALHRE